jgi:hypothetical protein
MGGKKMLRMFLAGDKALRAFLLGSPRERCLVADALREKYQGAFTIEVTHEQCARTDILLQQFNKVSIPHELTAMDWCADADFIAEQLNTRLFEEPSDIVVLSVQPDIAHSVWEHRQSGYLLSPPPPWERDWPPARKTWFAENFVPRGLLSVAQFRENAARLIGAVKEQLGAHVLMFNHSTVDPDDYVHNYHGREPTWALRTHQFNLALMELSIQEGISIIDVERLVAELGASRNVLQAGCYSSEVHASILGEFLRVLEDVGFFEDRPLVMQVGRRNVLCS